MGLCGSIKVGTRASVASIHRLLLTTAWFASLPLEKRQALINIAEQRDMRRGETLWRQGDEGGSVCVVLCGLLEDFEVDAKGEHGATMVRGPGSWFGAITALSGQPRRANIVALGPTKILELPSEPLLALLRARPEFYPHFIRLIAQSIEPGLAQMRSQALHGDQRLYRVLRHLCVAQQSALPGSACSFPLTQQKLADITGLTRLRVMQLISGLRADGIVSTSYGGIEVLDVPRLEALTLMPKPPPVPAPTAA